MNLSVTEASKDHIMIKKMLTRVGLLVRTINLSITEDSKVHNMIKELLIRVGLSVRYCNRFMDMEGYESTEELTEATVKGLKTAI